MNDHTPRPLPDAASLPLGLVQITVWTQTSAHRYTGTAYQNDSTGWFNPRQAYDRLIPGNNYDWQFESFRISEFSRGWFRMEKNKTPALVRMALWCLERWAKDERLIEQ